MAASDRDKKGKFTKGHKPSFDGWKGKTFSIEHRKKLSDSRKGLPSPNKGKKASIETREKQRQARLGKKISLEQRRKQSETMKRLLKKNPRPPESYSRFHEASRKANIGRPLTEEHKLKIGLGNKGKIVSQETRQKMSVSSKAGMTKERMKKILTRRIPTSLETQFQKIAKEYKLPYRYVGDGSFIIGHYNPDFVNTNGEKIAIEVYAKYFKQKKNASIKGWKIGRQNTFRKYGWKLLFFDETQVNEKHILKVLGV